MPTERNTRKKETNKQKKKSKEQAKKKKEKQHSSCVEQIKPIHLLAKNTFEHSGATISSREKCARDESHTARLVSKIKTKKLVPSTRYYRHRQGTFVECQSRTTRTSAGVAGGHR